MLTSMLWSGKQLIVGVTVDTYAMVGVSVNSGYRGLGNARSENTHGALCIAKKQIYSSIFTFLINFHTTY